MIRLYVLVEGDTEEKFVKQLLYEPLLVRQIDARPIIVTTRRDRLTGQKLSRGGGRWVQWCKDLRRLISEHHGKGVFFTTLFDLYGLPDDFPAIDEHRSVSDTTRRATLLEEAMGRVVNDPRFIPYLQRHEFEAFVFAGLDKLEQLLDSEAQFEGLRQLRKEAAGLSPEDVDDGVLSAPSRRLVSKIPGYRKTLHGPLVTESLGLAALKEACPRFCSWVMKLENLSDH